jgi:NADP-dependent 3-hydroxy acid dehydrogenase YdfG
MPASLQDKWVLITGASSGFGAAAAVAFGREGARVLLGARREDRLKEVAAKAIEAGAAAAEFHRLDVASTPSVETFAQFAKSKAGKIDILINNAGGAHGLEPVTQGRDEDWEAMIQSNVLGVLRMSRAIIPLMEGTNGYLINIGSIAGHVAYENGAAYCACKAAELSITRALRLELCGTGIRVGTVDPGLAETEFSMVRFKGDAARSAKVYEGTEPLTGEDIAETLVWLASRPAHVCIDELIIKPTDQAAIHKVHRRTVAK